jgi:hypothetical protein
MAPQPYKMSWMTSKTGLKNFKGGEEPEISSATMGDNRNKASAGRRYLFTFTS